MWDRGGEGHSRFKIARQHSLVAYAFQLTANMSSSDSDGGEGGKKKGGNKHNIGRISKSHRLEMESWLAADRVYSGGKVGAKQKNIRWCLGGGEKGLKGLTDAKETKSGGAYEKLAAHINKVFQLKGEKMWTRSIAEKRFKNMMKSFREACRKNPLPREKDYPDKNDYATAMEKCEEERKSKCSSYFALWVACNLKDHPKFSGVGRLESSKPSDSSDDFEDPPWSKKKQSESEGDRSDTSSTSSKGNGDDESEGDAPDTPSGAKTMLSPGKPSSPRSPVPKLSPAGPKRRLSAKKPGKSKKTKWSLPKGKSTTKHQDIVSAYLECKRQQNDHFLHVAIVAQRRGTFFDCWDRNIRSAADIQAVFDSIGIGAVPHLMPLQSQIHEPSGDDRDDNDAADGADEEEDI
jgi:hypothetical protein